MRLLARGSNEVGDLFARLAGDVFLALGYENPRLNIHKTGREIDLQAHHRQEDKRAIGECKATKDPVGADALNKFAGVLQVEAAGGESSNVQGYFVSLSGFRESAYAQEQEAGPRFVLLDGLGVQAELVAGSLIVSPEVACEAAGRLAAGHDGIVLTGQPELLAHRIGWIWLCVFETDHQPSHFALIHADGRALAASLAMEIKAADRDNDGSFHQLEYLSPTVGPHAKSIEAAERGYRNFLLAELGEITLEGLPADEEAGVRQIALEDLYVPLNVEPMSDRSEDYEGLTMFDDYTYGEPDLYEEDITPYEDDVALYDEEDGVMTLTPRLEDAESETSELANAEPVGGVLRREQRMAILAPPGAGKSTLIKRLAVAYASETHRKQIDDELPNEDWLPVFIRCRSLGSNSRQPIREIIDDIPNVGEFPEHRDGFSELVASALRAGKVILLVDGLDEIANEGDRLAFVRRLRTFLSVYPSVGVVLTSREAGFRAIGGAMSSVCQKYKLSEFDDQDIHQLTLAWHETVVGKSGKVQADADALASTIVATDRVRRLAKNPLLLTTLLLVKRWVGDLPRKRTVLYEKAIEVLLMTWNVEAHEPIDREEAIPQLAFVAHALTERGVQSLSSITLAELLTSARRQMPEVLGYARTSVTQFVERVESRSSLLIMTGHVEENGQLVPLYEFRHLTFQEYLAAVAIVEGFYDGHDDGDNLAAKVAVHINDPRWAEVIALANVRAGRSAGAVVAKILDEADRGLEDNDPDYMPPESALLGRCLADEVQLSPDLVVKVSREFGRWFPVGIDASDLVTEILESRYGEVFTQTISEAYADDSDPKFTGFADIFAAIGMSSLQDWSIDASQSVRRVTEMLSDTDESTAALGAMCAMNMVYRAPRVLDDGVIKHEVWPSLLRWSKMLITWCARGPVYVQYSASWALAWLGDRGAVAAEDRAEGLRVLLNLWRESKAPRAQKQAAWAFSAMPGVDRASKPLGDPTFELCRFAEEQFDTDDTDSIAREDRRPAAVILGYYLGKPWSDSELAKLSAAVGQEAIGPLGGLDRASRGPTGGP